MAETAPVAPRIPPPVTDVNRAFWTGGANGQLLIQRCGACDRWVHPPTEACPTCGGALEAAPVSGRGTVYTFTVNRHRYHPDVPPPYVLAIVELVEQRDLRFTTNIVHCDPEAVSIGMEVQVVFEPIGTDGQLWAPVFEPVA